MGESSAFFTGGGLAGGGKIGFFDIGDGNKRGIGGGFESWYTRWATHRATPP